MYDRESAQQNIACAESLKNKLHVADTNHKSFETLANERAHQIATLEREVKIRDERLAGLEEARATREGNMRELEGKLAVTTDKITQLQVEKERLTQQVGITVIFHSTPAPSNLH